MVSPLVAAEHDAYHGFSHLSLPDKPLLVLLVGAQCWRHSTWKSSRWELPLLQLMPPSVGEDPAAPRKEDVEGEKHKGLEDPYSVWLPPIASLASQHSSVARG